MTGVFRIVRHISLIVVLLSPTSMAAGPAQDLPRAPLQYGDIEAMQRGAATFVNYCMGCHSAQYMRYGRLTEDIGLSDEMVQDFLIHNAAGLGDGMRTSMREADGKEWFYQAAPPDLSLSARLRNPDWLYAYLRGFYRDPSRPGGWNNAVFNNVAMPHVLADLQGVYVAGEEGGFSQTTEGRMSSEEYDKLVGDLVTYMTYMGEPARATRYKTGYLVMTFLLAMLLLTYFLYREYWRDIR